MKTIGVPQPQGGKKVDPWKPNKEVCPEYPYWTHYNEAGEIVYSIPMDVMNGSCSLPPLTTLWDSVTL